MTVGIDYFLLTLKKQRIMKKQMRIWSMMMLVVMTLSMMVACGDDDNNDSSSEIPKTDFNLSKQTVDMVYGNTEIVYCENVNATECDVLIEDDYVVTVSASKNAFNITSRHVGRTKLTIKKGSSSKTIDVTVNPTNNLIGIPYTLFGATKENIKAMYPASEILSERDNSLTISKSSPSLIHDYYFRNGLLYKLRTRIKSTKKYSVLEDILTEYASYYGTFTYIANGITSNIKSTGSAYKRGNDYYIGLCQVTGNDPGFEIIYATDFEEATSNK